MNSRNVHTGRPAVGGAIFTAPAGTPIPTDATTNLSPEFVELGYASDSGISNSVSTDSNTVHAWGGDEVLNENTTRSEEFNFQLIEISEATLTEAYGKDNVTLSGDGLAVLHNARALPERVHVYEILLGKNRVKRIVVPRAKISERGDVVYNGTDPIGYELTVAALPDSDGNTAYTFIAETV